MEIDGSPLAIGKHVRVCLDLDGKQRWFNRTRDWPELGNATHTPVTESALWGACK